MDEKVKWIGGEITLADGTKSQFTIGEGGDYQQWGADRERLGRSVDVVQAMVDGIREAGIEIGEEP